MGRKKTYTALTLRKAVRKYFNSITRIVKLTEKKGTGRKDEYGHEIYESVPVLNSLEEQAAVMEYLVPPTIGGLCAYLGIARSTWSRWTNPEDHPEFKEIIEEVDDRLMTWKNEQILLRKDVKGLIWDLEVNHGCGKKADHGQVTVKLKGVPTEYAE